jgi:hypothetical protein
MENGAKTLNASRNSEFLELHQLTAHIQAVLAKLDANDAEHIDLALEFGSLIAKAKEILPHGEFRRWCDVALDRSPSWCSLYRRLFENRDDVEPALNWALAIKHKRASCRSVERLLGLINDYRKATGLEPHKSRRSRTSRGGVATLERRLNGCEKTVVAFFDAVAPYWVPRARRLAEVGDDPNKALAELALRIRRRAGDLGETCSSLQLSSPEACSYPEREDSEVDLLDDESRVPGALQ